MTQSPLLVLEPAARKFAEDTAKPPYLPELGAVKGRALVDQVQAGAIVKPDVDIEDTVLPVGPSGAVSVRILRPKNARRSLPVILYIHGAGWVFGNAHTHDRLIRELAAGSGAAVVFPSYSLSPEARYPTALEECFATAQWLVAHGETKSLDGARIAVAGDSVGGNMAISTTLLAKRRGGVAFREQVLFYPVTNAAFDTESYERFKEGYFLRRDAMQWFWDQYITDPGRRAEITASPLRASATDLSGLPPALVITAEADVLRDEGEAYAAKLREAGVAVTALRCLGVIHDFAMLNALRETEGAQMAIGLAITTLRAALFGGAAPTR